MWARRGGHRPGHQAVSGTREILSITSAGPMEINLRNEKGLEECPYDYISIEEATVVYGNIYTSLSAPTNFSHTRQSAEPGKPANNRASKSIEDKMVGGRDYSSKNGKRNLFCVQILLGPPAP
ncbi:predicted protein [Histoplasma capsulatum H143]|uniref:Uncharacterized protein n=1 Tax=Ajellomyces capsulatus (strain H143) TaxID=544712 RepID=C6HL86_AJECH|nr:predicted protein [Histoplasma capsulatum H143]